MQAGGKIALYRSLFRGRDDIFARRWEKGGKSGYSPAYSFDGNEFNVHRARGGSLKDFDNKTPLALTNEVVREHLAGRAALGVYPILTNNTSYFLAADFDHGDWLADCIRYREEMAALGLTAYIERSRSGNGGHVWVFFEGAYPCYKSRAIGLEIARKVLGLSAFDKEASFDRLFPSQDVITKKGLGNLIALPFQGSVARDSNTVFLDPVTSEPFEDQYSVLKSIKRHTPGELDKAHDLVTGEPKEPSATKSKKLRVTVDQNITLQKAQLNSTLVSFLKVLELYLKGQWEVLTFTGDDSAAGRTSKLKQVNDGHYQVLLATGQLFGEGMHVENIEALILAFPFAFEGKLIHYLGRLMHSTEPRVLIDYHDKNIPFLDRQFKKRQRVYNKL